MTDMPDRWADLGEFIRQQRETARLSLRKLSEVAGISNPYLSQIERGLRKPSAEILQQIAKGLHLSAETLYVRAGILERDLDDQDIVRMIRTDPHLDPYQREALVRIYLSFLHENGYEPDENAIDDSAAPIGPQHAESSAGPESTDEGSR